MRSGTGCRTSPTAPEGEAKAGGLDAATRAGVGMDGVALARAWNRLLKSGEQWQATSAIAGILHGPDLFLAYDRCRQDLGEGQEDL